MCIFVLNFMRVKLGACCIFSVRSLLCPFYSNGQYQSLLLKNEQQWMGLALFFEPADVEAPEASKKNLMKKILLYLSFSLCLCLGFTIQVSAHGHGVDSQSGQTVCPTCNGGGWIYGYPCAVCGGTGQINWNSAPSTPTPNYTPQNSGSSQKEWHDCPTCHGSGECTNCNGYGVRSGRQCGVCSGSGRCAGCNGKKGYYVTSNGTIIWGR